MTTRHPTPRPRPWPGRPRTPMTHRRSRCTDQPRWSRRVRTVGKEVLRRTDREAVVLRRAGRVAGSDPAQTGDLSPGQALAGLAGLPREACGDGSTGTGQRRVRRDDDVRVVQV